MQLLLGRLLREDRGQDLIEYALLVTFIGLVGILTWQAIGSDVAAKYAGWDGGIQTLSSCTPDPGGAGC